ncbi:MAG: hypothetical protein HOQ22_18365 [Nocardioidaceae bacterium]|nr:hypothetical protein [Nocardioidaceae bacterium]NUS52990.1 hypothetical protein [Nocardioidaceae bacterium]
MFVDPLEVPLQDDALVEEIQLLTSLIVAAGTTDVLHQDDIDLALGLAVHRLAADRHALS